MMNYKHLHCFWVVAKQYGVRIVGNTEEVREHFYAISVEGRIFLTLLGCDIEIVVKDNPKSKAGHMKVVVSN